MNEKDERYGWYWWRVNEDSLWEVVLCGGSSFIRVGSDAAWDLTTGVWGERIASPPAEPE